MKFFTNMARHPLTPLVTVPLFPALSQALQTVLRGLSADDWGRVTACDPWTVKDVAAHLLGGNFGRLWAPDPAAPPPAFHEVDFETLTRLIDHGNAQWVEAARRISPGWLVELLALTDARLVEHFRALDPLAPAPISVAWVSPGPAPNWLDIAREYTEKWLHQQHIREAVGQPVLDAPELFGPVLATFAHAWPRALAEVPAAEGSSVVVTITGPAGGAWSIVRERLGWGLYGGVATDPVCRVALDPDTAWRLLTKGLSLEAALARTRVDGDPALGRAVLEAVAIMA